jgi:hypothetical protein
MADKTAAEDTAAEKARANETAAADTIYLQAEGRVLGFNGSALPPGIAARMASGELRRVSEDGSPWVERDEDEPAVRVTGVPPPAATVHVPEAVPARPQAFPAARSEPVVPPAHVPPPAAPAAPAKG